FVGRLASDFHVAEFQILRVSDVKAVCRELGAKHMRIRIFGLVFGRLESGHFLAGTAAVLEIQVADLDLLDGVSRNAADDRRQMSRGIPRSEEHTSELQSRSDLVCRLLL